MLLIIIVSVFLGIYISVLLHELGHLLFGFLMRLKFTSLSVGGIQLYLNTHRRLRLRFVRHLIWSGGFVAMYPIDGHHLRWRWIVFIAGGPIASLVSFFGFKFLLNFLNQNSFEGHLVASISSISLFSTIAVLIPYRTSIYKSDGLQLIQFLRGGPEMVRSIALMLLHGAAMQGIRCREWNEKWIKDAVEIKDKSASEVQANLDAYDWALDTGKISIAEGYLNRSLELVVNIHPKLTTTLYLAQAHFLAMYKNDAVGARAAFIKAVSNPLILAFYPLRSEAAVLYAEGHFEGARAKAQEGIRIYKELGSPKYGQEELHQLEEILEKTEKQLSGVTGSSSIVSL